MTTRGFASLCLKLVAVYYMIQTGAGLVSTSFFQMYYQSSQLGRMYATMVVGLPALMRVTSYTRCKKGKA